MLQNGASVTGYIEAGKGADTIDLGGSAATVRQNEGDSGAYAAPGAGEVVAATGFDAISGLNVGTKIMVNGYSAAANWANGAGALTAVSSLDDVATADNKAVLVRGTYAGGDFTAGAGTDALLIYDSTADGGETPEAVVLVGLSGLNVEINAAGQFVFA